MSGAAGERQDVRPAGNLIADQGIANARETSGALDGSRFRHLSLCLVLHIHLAGCSLLVDEHILHVRNETDSAITDLRFAIEDTHTVIARLETGVSTTIRLRVNAESEWTVSQRVGAEYRVIGKCGYTGTTPGRPTEHTVRLVSNAVEGDKECVVVVHERIGRHR